jgi:hypothetical protein
MKLLLLLLAILMFQSCSEDKPTVFLGFKLLDTEDHFVTHMETMNNSGELTNGKYEFKCGVGSTLIFELFTRYSGTLLDELSLSAAGTFKMEDSTEKLSNSPSAYLDCILNNKNRLHYE